MWHFKRRHCETILKNSLSDSGPREGSENTMGIHEGRLKRRLQVTGQEGKQKTVHHYWRWQEKDEYFSLRDLHGKKAFQHS